MQLCAGNANVDCVGNAGTVGAPSSKSWRWTSGSYSTLMNDDEQQATHIGNNTTGLAHLSIDIIAFIFFSYKATISQPLVLVLADSGRPCRENTGKSSSSSSSSSSNSSNASSSLPSTAPANMLGSKSGCRSGTTT